MLTIRPDDVRVWSSQEPGPTGNMFEDNGLIVVLMIAQRNEDWRPFTKSEFDETVVSDFRYFAELSDLLAHGHVSLVSPGNTQDTRPQYELTEASIALCARHSPALLARP